MKLSERIFIAGGTGMVGSSLKRIFTQKGYGNLKYGGEILSPTRKELNLLNYQEIKDWFLKKKPSIVVIAAAKVGGILANSKSPYDFIYENIKIQTNIIEVSKIFNVKKILFLGSSCIYPKYALQPIKEEYLLDGELEETNQWYAIAKISGIKLCEAIYQQYGINAISLMPCNLYGVGDNYNLSTSHVLPALIRRFFEAKKNSTNVICWGSGTPIREFLYVDDLAEACIFALEKWDITSNKAPLNSSKEKLAWLNVGSGEEITIKKLAEKIACIVGYEGKIIWDQEKPDGTPRKLLDSSKLRDLGWKPSINLEEGLKISLNDFKKRFY